MCHAVLYVTDVMAVPEMMPLMSGKLHVKTGNNVSEFRM